MVRLVTELDGFPAPVRSSVMSAKYSEISDTGDQILADCAVTGAAHRNINQRGPQGFASLLLTAE
jgi:hypothetical protein